MENQCIVFKNKQTMYNEIALSLKYLVCLFLWRSTFCVYIRVFVNVRHNWKPFVPLEGKFVLIA